MTEINRTAAAPTWVRASLVLRKLDVGEKRRVGDYTLFYNDTLMPVQSDDISIFPWRNRITKLMGAHYRPLSVSWTVTERAKDNDSFGND